MGLVPEGTPARRERHSAGRHRSRIELERLETRNLLSGNTNIPGVTVQYGALIFAPTKNSGNSAVVSIDTSNNNDVKVVYNGYSEDFSPSLIYTMTYKGGAGGGDTFTNDTSLSSLEYGYSGGNDFTGGTGSNYVDFWGNGNTYNAQAGSVNDVFEHGGKDTINNPYGATVYVYH
jgi:hypothetical protein